MLELHFLDTVVWPRHRVFKTDPYCRTVGLMFQPSLIPRCWQKKFSTMSELKYPGLMTSSSTRTLQQRARKIVTAEFRSSMHSLVMFLASLVEDSHSLKKFKHCWISPSLGSPIPTDRLTSMKSTSTSVCLSRSMVDDKTSLFTWVARYASMR